MNTDRQVIAAFFRSQSDAEKALADLRSAGFRADQIGSSFGTAEYSGTEYSGSDAARTDRHDDRSFWDKIEGFFSGDEGYEDRDTGVGDGRYAEGNRVGRTLQIPQRYNSRLSSGGCIITVHDNNRISEAEQILKRDNGEIDRDFGGNYVEDTNTSRMSGAETGERRIRLLSEVLRVNKERVSKGEVRLRKEVRTETQNVEVPVTHEELVIERVPVENQSATNAQIGTDQEIRVPLSEERVTVDKSPVVREEVRVGKRAVQETQTVSDNVRHEELNVDDKDNIAGTNKKQSDTESPRRGNKKIA
jgi:uncharacterized protein (TIGR02271 family)